MNADQLGTILARILLGASVGLLYHWHPPVGIAYAVYLCMPPLKKGN